METGEAYSGLAGVYDFFMDDLPYEAWAERIDGLIKKYRDIPETQASSDGSEPQENPEINVVVDAGCGTGTMTRLLAMRGYDMIGIDLSEDMLAEAAEKEAEDPLGIFYLQQDMREMELFGCAGAFVSTGDSINYLLTDEDLLSALKQAEKNLLPGGVFILDFKTCHLFRDIAGDQTIAESREEGAFIWENRWFEEVRDPEDLLEEMEGFPKEELRHINEYRVTVFQKDRSEEELFHRSVEIHYQRGYSPEEIESAAERAGLSMLLCIDSDSGKDVDENTVRALAVLKKPALPEGETQ